MSSSSSLQALKMETVKVPVKELDERIRTVLAGQGHDPHACKIITDTLMFAELRNNNQGIVKLLAGALMPSPKAQEIKSVTETPVSCNLDGGHQIGMVVLRKAVDIAIEKAKTSGISIIGCYNYASATGALGAWARDIAQQGLIGVVLSQCPEMVAPHGSYEPIFGTNPFAIGIPTKGRVQVLDMATSASAWYGLVTAKEQGLSIPDDIAYDKDGRPTTDPAEAMRGALRVFDRSYKGSHLALMVELLAGALPGADMEDKHNKHNWGSLVIAIDPKILGPVEGFQERAEVMCNRVKNAKRLPTNDDLSKTGSSSPPSSANSPMYLPGERGDELEAENLARGSIEMSKKLYLDLVALQNKYEKRS